MIKSCLTRPALYIEKNGVARYLWIICLPRGYVNVNGVNLALGASLRRSLCIWQGSFQNTEKTVVARPSPLVQADRIGTIADHFSAQEHGHDWQRRHSSRKRSDAGIQLCRI